VGGIKGRNGRALTKLENTQKKKQEKNAHTVQKKKGDQLEDPGPPERVNGGKKKRGQPGHCVGKGKERPQEKLPLVPGKLVEKKKKKQNKEEMGRH